MHFISPRRRFFMLYFDDCDDWDIWFVSFNMNLSCESALFWRASGTLLVWSICGHPWFHQRFFCSMCVHIKIIEMLPKLNQFHKLYLYQEVQENKTNKLSNFQSLSSLVIHEKCISRDHYFHLKSQIKMVKVA